MRTTTSTTLQSRRTNSKRTSRTAVALTAIAVSLAAGWPMTLFADAPAPPPTPPVEETRTTQPFRLFWGVETNHDDYRWRNARWAESIDVGTTAVSYDFVLFYQRYLGIEPRAGYHVTMAPGYMDAHRAALAVQIARWIPDPNFDGFVCIEWEYAPFGWLGRSENPQPNDPLAVDRDYGDDWYEYMQQSRPTELIGLSGQALEDYLKQTHDAAARNWFEVTQGEFRRLRPLAKLGWYNQPNRTYLDYYWPGPTPMKTFNDSTPWLWDQVDVLFPDIYAVRYTLPSNDQTPTDSTQNRPQENDRYIRSNIRECKRLAPGKPIIPIVHALYVNNINYDGQFMNPMNLAQTINIPHEEGALGIILWDAMESQQEADALEGYLQSSFLPFISPLIVNPIRRADTQPGADTGGAQNGGSGSGEAGSGAGASPSNPSDPSDSSAGGGSPQGPPTNNSSPTPDTTPPAPPAPPPVVPPLPQFGGVSNPSSTPPADPPTNSNGSSGSSGAPSSNMPSGNDGSSSNAGSSGSGSFGSGSSGSSSSGNSSAGSGSGGVSGGGSSSGSGGSSGDLGESGGSSNSGGPNSNNSVVVVVPDAVPPAPPQSNTRRIGGAFRPSVPPMVVTGNGSRSSWARAAARGASNQSSNNEQTSSRSSSSSSSSPSAGAGNPRTDRTAIMNAMRRSNAGVPRSTQASTISRVVNRGSQTAAAQRAAQQAAAARQSAQQARQSSQQASENP